VKPNAKGKAALLIIAALVFLVIGFVGGQLAKAVSTLPGDSGDPVATQSYVESTVGERLATLTTRIDELEAELAALKSGTTTNDGNTSNSGDTSNNSGDTTNNSGNSGSSGNSSNSSNSGSSTSTSTLTITGNTVNVRSGPGTNYSVVASVSKGDKVTLLGTEGDWYKVQVGNVTGYVASYLAE
jgi:hypothetical protein